MQPNDILHAVLQRLVTEDGRVIVLPKPNPLITGSNISFSGATVEELDRVMYDTLYRITVDLGNTVVIDSFTCDSDLSCSMNHSVVRLVKPDALLTDIDYAWTIHCGISMVLHDCGVEIEQANKMGARLMSALFHANTANHPYYKSMMEQRKASRSYVATFTMPNSDEAERVAVAEVVNYISAEFEASKQSTPMCRSIQFGPISLHSIDKIVDVGCRPINVNDVEITIEYTRSLA